MKKHFYLLKTFLCVFAAGVLVGCSSDGDSLQIPEGNGIVALNVNTDTGFQTRAAGDNAYKNLDNYTVQILQGDVVYNNHEYAYSEMPEFIELPNGAYTFKAFYGTDKDKYIGADSTNIYFSAQQNFELRGDTTQIALTCKPNSARVNIVFDALMDTYFSDYSMSISTEAQNGSTYSWTKTTEGPIFFKVNQEESVSFVLSVTPKTGYTAKVTTNKYTLSPGDAKKITVKPSVNSGDLTISITIDDKTVEHKVDIDIPSDWV